MKKCLTLMLALVMVLALMLPVSAAKSDFVPSAEVKPAPGIVEKPSENGTPVVGEIIMPDGTVITVPGGAIVITPLQGADSADPSIGKALEEAYKDILDAESLKDLIENIEDILDQIDKDLDADDLVVSDLFHIFLDGEYVKYLEEGGSLKVTFKTDDAILALMKTDKWSALFGDKFVDNGDGTITLTISKAGVVAFLKNAAKVDVNPDDPGVSSPTTGDKTAIYLVLGTVFALAAVAFVMASKKQTA